jgi:Leucine-rich repeat (LRR) protein
MRVFNAGPIAAEIGLLPITNLELHGTSLSGVVPNSLCGNSGLGVADVSSNLGITCVPDCLTTVGSVNFTGLQQGCPSDTDNGFCGLVASSNVHAAVSPGDAVLWACDDQGYPASALCGWAGVTCSNGGVGPAVLELDLTGYGFGGSLPASLGSLSSLQSLKLGGNSLGGSLPTSLGSLSELTVLSLEGNSLVGPLPHSLFELTLLGQIVAHYNSLTGMYTAPVLCCAVLSCPAMCACGAVLPCYVRMRCGVV